MFSGRESLTLTSAGGGINAVAFSPDGKLLAGAGMEPGLVVWDLETKRQQVLVGSGVEITSVAFSSDGQFLASGGRDKAVQLWNAKTRTLVRTIGGLDSEINSLTFSPDGHSLALGYANSSLEIVDFTSSASKRHFDHGSGEVLKVAFTRRSGVSFGGLRSQHRSGMPPLAWRCTLKGPAASTNGLSFSADGRWLLSGGRRPDDLEFCDGHVARYLGGRC
jgi:WD40 repeat protein